MFENENASVENNLNLESKLEIIPIQFLIANQTDDKSPECNDHKSNVVNLSVKLHGYDQDAPPLFVMPTLDGSGKYLVLDGKARLAGALKNTDITELPCIIINNLTVAEAQKYVARFNAPVRTIKKPVTLGQHVVAALDNAERNRQERKNIILSGEQFELLQEQTRESSKSLNRALHSMRKIIKRLREQSSENAKLPVKELIENVIDKNVLPELNEFYHGGLPAFTFERRCLEREREAATSESEIDVAATSTKAELKTTRLPKPTPSKEAQDAQTTSRVFENCDNLLEFILFLKAESEAEDETPSPESQKVVAEFLLLNPQEKPWIALLTTIFELFNPREDKKTHLLHKRRATTEPIQSQEAHDQTSLFDFAAPQQ